MSANKGSDHIVIATTNNDDQGGGAVSSAESSKDQASCKDTLHIMARRVRQCTSPQKIRHVMYGVDTHGTDSIPPSFERSATRLKREHNTNNNESCLTYPKFSFGISCRCL